MSKRMPILRQHHVLELPGNRVDDWHDLMTVCRQERSPLAEVILQIDSHKHVFQRRRHGKKLSVTIYESTLMSHAAGDSPPIRGRRGQTVGNSEREANHSLGDAAVSAGMASSVVSIGFASAWEACNTAKASLLPREFHPINFS